MFDAIMALVAAVLIAGGVVAASTRLPQELRPWVWLAFGEYMLCSAAQLIYSRVIVHGGDMMLYSESGILLARLMDANFGFVTPEVLNLLFQRPSAFDSIVYAGGGGNTGSMHAIVALVIFLFRGSDIGAHVFVSGLALFATLGIFHAFAETCPEIPAKRIFVATVLFPSVAFWTCAFHKECFGIIGFGIFLTGWRGVYSGRWVRALFGVPVGLVFIFLFRAPTLGPLLLGVVTYFVAERVRRTKGPKATLFGPAYFFAGLVLLLVGMLALSRLDPSLGVDKIGESMATKQQGWSASAGGSNLVMDTVPQTLGDQAFRVPLAVLNALLRPQIFDVHNFGGLVGAVEMTAVLWILVRAVRRQGFSGVLSQIQGSPFLLMCAVVTFVGCTLVGMVTLNLGSLSRYRVPFLPFYGGMLAGLIDLPERVKSKTLATGEAALARIRVRIPSRAERPPIPTRDPSL